MFIRPRARVLGVVLGAMALLGGACSTGERPELVDAPPPSPTEPAVVPDVVDPTPGPEPGPTASPTSAPTAVPSPTAPPVALTRGVTDDTVRIGVVVSERFFRGFGDAVLARAARANRDGGVAGRQIEVSQVIDDDGDPDSALSALQTLVESDEVFAVVTGSVALDETSVSYLEENQVPHTGWGVTGAFCEPNRWGFGFSGCLGGSGLGVDGAVPNPAYRDPIVNLIGPEPSIVLVSGDGPAGDAARAETAALWGEGLAATVVARTDADAAETAAAVAAAVAESDVDAVLVRLPLEAAVALKQALAGEGLGSALIDDSSYVPGLLGDFSTATALEGTYAIAQLPAQESLGDATQRIAFDLADAGLAGPDLTGFVLSAGHSVGYWSTDLLVALLGAVDDELDTAAFQAAVDGDFGYDSGLAGGPCPIAGADIRRQPAGGASLMRVEGGIYRPVVDWAC